MFTVYIIQSKKDGRYYYGQTENIAKRIAEHNSGLSGYTSKYSPWELVYTEEYATRSEAMKREKYFKSTSGRRYLIAHKIIQDVAETNPPALED